MLACNVLLCPLSPYNRSDLSTCNVYLVIFLYFRKVELGIQECVCFFLFTGICFDHFSIYIRIRVAYRVIDFVGLPMSY